MRLFLTFEKRTLFLIFLVMVLLVFFFSAFSSAANAGTDGNTLSERITFLKQIGCRVDSQSERHKTISIPHDFSDVYLNYNAVQKQAGYDLAFYKGCECEHYSYDVVEFNGVESPEYYKANLIVYNGRIIGGDISSSEIDGEMLPLMKRYEKTEVRQIYIDPA